MTNEPYKAVLLSGLFGWAICRRIRRNIGRQKMKPRWLVFRMVLLSLVSESRL
jgi:hypothetical protein